MGFEPNVAQDLGVAPKSCGSYVHQPQRRSGIEGEQGALPMKDGIWSSTARLPANRGVPSE